MLRFGAFELNPASGELRKAGIPIKIGPQPFRVLLLLAEHPRQVVTRKEIQRYLWGDDTFVDYEHGINFCVNQIRAALSDDAERPRYIETLPRRGYRFLASVSSQIPGEAAPARAPIDISSVPWPVEPPQAVAHIPELQIVPQPQRRTHRRKWMYVAGISVIGLAFCLYWVARRVPTRTREPKATQITANSLDNPVTSSAISPDGKYLAFTDKLMRIRLRLLATGETQTIPEPSAFADASVGWTISAWFPDSTRFLANASAPAAFTGMIHDRVRFGTIFHEVSRDPQEERSIWIVPIFGKQPEKLRDNAEAFSISPDGSLVAFGTKHDRLGGHEIWLMDSKGQQARKLYDAPAETALAGFSWLQDGQRGIYFKFDDSKGQLIARGLNGGPAITLVSFPDQERLSDFISLPGGRLIYAESDDAPGRSCNLWELRMDSHTGKPLDRARRLTNFSGSCAETISATSDGKRLAFQRSQPQTTVNVAELEANANQLSAAKHLTLNEYVNAAETWTPDSKALVFRSLRNGHLKLFKQTPDSDVEEPLVLGAENVAGAAVSPDGSWLFYLSCGPTTDECGDRPAPLMGIPISGGTPHTVLTSDTYGRPRCAVSPSKLCVFAEQNNDGEPIIFTAFDIHGRGPELARFETEPRTAYAWGLSSDGTRIAILKFWGSQIHVLSLKGQAVDHVAVKGAGHLAGIYWTADGRGWFTASQSPAGTALLHVDRQGATHPIWEMKGNTIAYGVPSPDGRHLAIVETARSSNVWLLENF